MSETNVIEMPSVEETLATRNAMRAKVKGCDNRIAHLQNQRWAGEKVEHGEALDAAARALIEGQEAPHTPPETLDREIQIAQRERIVAGRALVIAHREFEGAKRRRASADAKRLRPEYQDAVSRLLIALEALAAANSDIARLRLEAPRLPVAALPGDGDPRERETTAWHWRRAVERMGLLDEPVRQAAE